MKTKVIISLDILEKNSLSPNEYIYLYHLLHNKTVNFPVDIVKLEKQQFIKIVSGGVLKREYNIKKLFPDMELSAPKVAKIPDNWQESWDKLCKLYYPKGHKGRRVRDLSKAKPKFLLAIKKHSIDDMIKGLEIEIKERETLEMRGEFAPPPKNLSTWINQETWLMFLEEMEEEEEIDRTEAI